MSGSDTIIILCNNLHRKEKSPDYDLHCKSCILAFAYRCPGYVAPAGGEEKYTVCECKGEALYAPVTGITERDSIGAFVKGVRFI